MDIDSPIKTPAATFACGLFVMAIIFSMIIFPRQGIQKDITLVFKGPRPYKSNIPGIAAHTHLNTSKMELSFQPIILAAASRHSVDPALVKAVIMAESSYNPMAISKKGAIGLMQLMPETADDMGVEDIFNPEHNVNAGVRYLKKLLNRFEGDLELALAAYNAGSTNVIKFRGVPPYKATQRYVKKVFE